ncbi:DUF6553 family protein [Butyrivibrio sp. AD3002]|uniref:DUF6553 family protein n=1 Tax=Butyrivibrio sp. AD3002 TaxID=1280670 RepID=UPI0003B3B37F|nr:DUF6553 family protein [Butyrivibrio sp. AD3002]
MLRNTDIYNDSHQRDINNYHEIEDIAERRDYLLSVIAGTDEIHEAAIKYNCLNPPASADEAAMRIQVLDHRYENKGGQWIDRYMHAFMMLLTMNRASGISLFNKKRKAQCAGYLSELGLVDNAAAKEEDYLSLQLEEWVDFAVSYIKVCINDKTYGSAFGGMIHMQDKDAAMKVISDIDTALYEIPMDYELIEEAKPLYKIFKETYCRLLESGTSLWQEYMNGKDH